MEGRKDTEQIKKEGIKSWLARQNVQQYRKTTRKVRNLSKTAEEKLLKRVKKSEYI